MAHYDLTDIQVKFSTVLYTADGVEHAVEVLVECNTEVSWEQKSYQADGDFTFEVISVSKPKVLAINGSNASDFIKDYPIDDNEEFFGLNDRSLCDIIKSEIYECYPDGYGLLEEV
jgi:hypothetical protein